MHSSRSELHEIQLEHYSLGCIHVSSSRQKASNNSETMFRFGAMMEDNEDLRKHADCLLTSMCLVCIETGHDAQLIELFRLCFALQELALDYTTPLSADFSTRKRAALHNVVAKYMLLCSQLLDIPMLCQHVQQTLEARRERGHPLLDVMTPAQPLVDPLNVAAAADATDANDAEHKANSADEQRQSKAPIASMESEDDWTARPLGLESDTSLLFNMETVADILKVSATAS